MQSIIDFENSIKDICKSYSDKICYIDSKMMKEIQYQINNSISEYFNIIKDSYASIDIVIDIDEDYQLRLFHSIYTMYDNVLYTSISKKRIIDGKESCVILEEDMCVLEYCTDLH